MKLEARDSALRIPAILLPPALVFLARLAVQHVLVATRAVLLQLNTRLRILTVLFGRIRAFLALSALQRHDDSISFLCASHASLTR